MAKKPRKTSEPKKPTERQAKYAAERAKGKSRRQAALAAGYSQSVADNASQIVDESRGIRENFATAIRRAIPTERIVERLSEGLDATHNVVIVTGRKGQESVDVRAVPDFRERREYAKLAAVMGGYHNERLELAGAKDVDVHIHLVGA